MDISKIQKEVAVVLGIALVTGAMFSPSLFKPVTTCVIGDARARWNGFVPTELRQATFDAQEMELGLGAAALDGWRGLGDALAVGGRVWLRPTDRDASDFYRLATGRFFQSSAFTYVPKGQLRRASWRPTPGATVADNSARLARDFPDGVVAAGFMQFRELHTIAIAAPAANGQPILRVPAQYYTQPMETAYDTWAYVITLTGPAVGRRFWDQRLRDRLFAPAAAGKSMQAHALRIRGGPGRLHTPPRRQQVVSVGEVVDSSIITDGELALFPIARVAACRDAIHSVAVN